MDPITIIVALVVLLLVGALIVQPFFSAATGDEGGRGSRRAAAVLRERADLLTQRNNLYATLRDLDFDFKTNKVAEDDYRAQRYQLVAQGVELLQRLDGLPDAGDAPDGDFIEAAVAAMSGSGQAAVVAAPARARSASGGFCPNCGKAVSRSDKFCGSCGSKL